MQDKKKGEDDGQKFGFQKTQKFVAWKRPGAEEAGCGRGRVRKRPGVEEAGRGRGWVRKRPGAEEAGACGKDANQKLRFDAE